MWTYNIQGYAMQASGFYKWFGVTCLYDVEGVNGSEATMEVTVESYEKAVQFVLSHQASANHGVIYDD